MNRCSADRESPASQLPSDFFSSRSWTNHTQWSSIIRDISGAEHLKTRIVLSIEGRHSRWKACLLRIVRVIKPQSQVKGVHRWGWRIRGRIREWGGGMGRRCGSRPRRDDEGLYAESADEPAMTNAMSVCLYIALVPRQAERSVGHLYYEEIEVRLCWKSPYFDVHYFNWTDRLDSYPPLCIRQNIIAGCTTALERTRSNWILSFHADADSVTPASARATNRVTNLGDSCSTISLGFFIYSIL